MSMSGPNRRSLRPFLILSLSLAASCAPARAPEPYLEFLTNLVRPAIGIVPAGSGPDFFRHPVGTGPYQLLEFLPEREIRLQAFEGYFEGAPQVKQLRFRIIPDDTTRALELER